MKKNQKVLLVLALVLAIVAAFVVINKKGYTIKKELRDFAVKDTAAIDKIFLADRRGNKVTLTRISSGKWKVNNKYTVRPDLINLLLETMATIEVKMPVAKNAITNTINRLASSSIKCEIYTNGDLAKVYYVGGATQDNYGTFMMLEDSKVPFITQLPDNRGYLTPRYVTLEDEWRDKALFRYEKGTIEGIQVSYRDFPTNNFSITKAGSEYELRDSKNAVLAVNPIQLLGYLGQFGNLNVESYVEPSNKDSILLIGSFMQLKIKSTDGKSETMEVYRRPNFKGNQDENGQPFPFDIDANYARIMPGDKFAVIQNFSFNKVFISPAEFLKTNQK